MKFLVTTVAIMFNLLLLLMPSAASARTLSDDVQIYNYKEVAVNIKKAGPTLIFSDSPEMVPDIGILYQDVVKGDSRLFFHHVNDTQDDKRLAVIIENRDIKPLKLKIKKNAISAPELNYMQAGKEVQQKYFAEQPNTELTIPMFGKYELLSGDNNGMVYKPQELITAMVDFETDGDVKVTVLCLPQVAIAKEYVDIAPVLAADHLFLRGTFKNADRYVTVKHQYNPAEDRNICFTLADDQKDVFARGIDATTGQPAVNTGNYGVVYYIDYKVKSADKFAISLNSLAGYLAGQVVVQHNDNQKMYVDVPKSGFDFGKNYYDTMVIGEYAEKGNGRIVFSPPGAGNLPIRIFFHQPK